MLVPAFGDEFEELINLNVILHIQQVCRDPRWGRCYESFSEDPEIVKKMTDIIIGLQGEIPADSRKSVPYVGGKYVQRILS